MKVFFAGKLITAIIILYGTNKKHLLADAWWQQEGVEGRVEAPRRC
jgi:hypothetical protein